MSIHAKNLLQASIKLDTYSRPCCYNQLNTSALRLSPPESRGGYECGVCMAVVMHCSNRWNCKVTKKFWSHQTNCNKSYKIMWKLSKSRHAQVSIIHLSRGTNGGTKCSQFKKSKIANLLYFKWLAIYFCAQNGTRTRTPGSIVVWDQRVYQFRHRGTLVAKSECKDRSFLWNVKVFFAFCVKNKQLLAFFVA